MTAEPAQLNLKRDMAPLVVFAMWALQWQCSSAVKMMRMKTYSDSGCTAANMVKDNWVPTEECESNSASKSYHKLTCDGDNAVSTLYSDSKCTTKETDTTVTGYVKGVADPKDKCVSYEDGGSSWSTITCANQPTIGTFVAYSDSSCTTAVGGAEKMHAALNFCEFQYEEEKGTKGKSSSTLEEAKKITVTGDKLESKEYTTKDCSDAGKVTVTGTLPCVEIEKGKTWYKVESSTAAGSSAAASSSTSANSSNTTATKASASSAPLQYLSLCTFTLSVTLAAFAL